MIATKQTTHVQTRKDPCVSTQSEFIRIGTLTGVPTSFYFLAMLHFVEVSFEVVSIIVAIEIDLCFCFSALFGVMLRVVSVQGMVSSVFMSPVSELCHDARNMQRSLVYQSLRVRLTAVFLSNMS